MLGFKNKSIGIVEIAKGKTRNETQNLSLSLGQADFRDAFAGHDEG